MPTPLICQSHLPFKPWMAEGGVRLPGLSPTPIKDWLLQDDVFTAQMAYRDHLIESNQAEIYQCLPEAEDGAHELLETLIDELPHYNAGYGAHQAMIKRPDGITVQLTDDAPLLIAGKLVQEDFALLQKIDEMHRLVGGLICFPASWRLGDKIGRTIADLHRPVDDFDQDMARRTERIFNMLRPEAPLQRANVLIYTNPDLHHPLPEGTAKTISPNQPRYVRVERQTLRRLPISKVIVFAIHTFLIAATDLTDEEFVNLSKLRPKLTKY